MKMVKISLIICIGMLILLPFISSFGQLIDPDSVLTETQVETYINNSNFSWGDNNITASTGFFTWLGNLVNRITKLFVQDIDFNGTITGTGNITTTGNITSDYFFGNGSQLTGIIHTIDTNETTRFNALVTTDCAVGTLVIGVQANGTVLCATDAGGIWTNVSGTATFVGDANVTGDIYSNNYQVTSYQRTVDIKNVTMTAVI